MSPGVLTTGPETSLVEAVKLMMSPKRKWLVVVDEKNTRWAWWTGICCCGQCRWMIVELSGCKPDLLLGLTESNPFPGRKRVLFILWWVHVDGKYR